MSGVLILTVGTVLAKIFSAIYRIVLTRILGGVGIGLYQLIFPLYSLCVVLVTAGLPLAVSKLVAKYPKYAKKIISKIILFMTFISLGIGVSMLILGSIDRTNANYLWSYVILAPTIVLTSTSAVLKGYFQGKHEFQPSAISNIIEQFIKMTVGLLLSLILVNIDIYLGIIGAIIGVAVSEIVSLVVLVLFYKKSKPKRESRIDISYKELLKDVLPITITNIILPLASFVDSILVVKLLTRNFSSNMSVFLYGLESGAVSSIASIPTIFSFSIASVILPNLSSNVRDWNKNYTLSLSVKVILTIVVPCVIAFLFIPDRIIGVIYSTKLNDLGINGTKIASALLALTGLGMVALSINQIYSISLQAVNKRYVTIRNSLLGVLVKFFIELIFLPTVRLNIYSLAIANTICYILIMALNYAEINNTFKLKINYLFGAKLLLCNFLMVMAMIGILAFGNSATNTILAIVVGGIVYLSSLYLVKIFNKRDMAIIKYKV